MERCIDMPKGNFYHDHIVDRIFLTLPYWHGALCCCLRKHVEKNRLCSPAGSVELTLDVAQVLPVMIIVPPSGSPEEKDSKP